ncbi:MAG TPA: glycosyltransferase, partial [Acidimicrobiales bacterium]|nr:glycosyltransferase [Acidimicrobiales bacterium]
WGVERDRRDAGRRAPKSWAARRMHDSPSVTRPESATMPRTTVPPLRAPSRRTALLVSSLGALLCGSTLLGTAVLAAAGFGATPAAAQPQPANDGGGDTTTTTTTSSTTTTTSPTTTTTSSTTTTTSSTTTTTAPVTATTAPPTGGDHASPAATPLSSHPAPAPPSSQSAAVARLPLALVPLAALPTRASAATGTPVPAQLAATGGSGVESPPAPLVLRLLSDPFATHGPMSPLDLALMALFLLVILALTGIAGTTLWWMLHAWRTPDTLVGTSFAGKAATGPGTGDGPGAAPARAPMARSYSLIVPARHEEAVLGTTLERLATLDHPSVEVLAVVGHDDPGTRQVAEAVAGRHPDRVRVVVDNKWPKNKPKALNTALAECRGAVTGVFDAEDEVHPDLLQHVDRCFDDTDADVVQGGVQLMNYGTSWWALHNVLEYYFWFKSRLHYHADQRFIPLGGNTVFVKTDLLRGAGGWDEDCLAEDCDIGVRLSTQGALVSVAYDPELVTREETPGSLASLFRQRTRWNQGFLQVLRKGVWRDLPTVRQRWLARFTLSAPFLQALIAVLIPMSIAAVVFLRLPVGVALLSFVPLLPTLVGLVVQAAGLREFCRSYGSKARIRDYVRLALGAPFYQMVLGAAAVRAVVREWRGQRGWEKTAHVGAHRAGELATSGGAA